MSDETAGGSPSRRRGGAVVVCPSAEAFAKEAASRIRGALDAAVRARGRARLALSGGATPLPAYELLAKSPETFERVEVFFVDERCVPADDARSNYAAVKRTLLDPASIAPERVFRMRGELSPRAGAATYEAALCARFEIKAEDAAHVDADGRSPASFDVLVAGVGNDGHTASLFPGTGAVERTDSLAIDVEPGGDLEPRLSLSRPVLIAAENIFVLARGVAKRPVVAAARRPGSEEEIPARLYLDARLGAVTWIVDRDAAPNPVAIRPD